MARGKRVGGLVVAAVLALCSLGAASACSARGDDASTFGPPLTTSTVPPVTSVPATFPKVTTVKPKAAKPTTTAAVPSTTAVAGDPAASTATTSSTAAAPPTTAGPGDLAAFCKAAKAVNFADLTTFMQFERAKAVKLVFDVATVQKSAPPDIAPSVQDIRVLVDALNQQVKAGEVTDEASFEAWIQHMNETDNTPIVKWIAGRTAVAAYVDAHCS